MAMTNTVTDQSTGDEGIASQAQDKVKEAGDQARGRVGQELDRRSTEVGERVGGTAGDARSVAEELRKQGKDTPARYVEQAADRAERLGGYLQRSDGDAMLRDVEDFARRNPWAIVAGGMALGLAASRMLKASSSERYQAGRQLDQGNGAGTGTGIGAGTGTRPSQFEPHV
jgi:ElaB/YqjD/DUF883 family membrane-anchored ribosome-binding protein